MDLRVPARGAGGCYVRMVVGVPSESLAEGNDTCTYLMYLELCVCRLSSWLGHFLWIKTKNVLSLIQGANFVYEIGLNKLMDPKERVLFQEKGHQRLYCHCCQVCV